MAERKYLHAELKSIMSSNGKTPHVYFEPPESLKMTYPCMVYEFSRSTTVKANNRPYMLKHYYQVTYVDSDPDNKIRDVISMLPNCVFDRTFTSDNLHHYVYTIYY